MSSPERARNMSDGQLMENRCHFWLPKKKRFCTSAPRPSSEYCGNHTQDHKRVACPIDPSHTVYEENLEKHVTRCPLLKRAQSLSLQPFYQMGINAGTDDDEDENGESRPIGCLSSEMKRSAVHSMTRAEISKLITKIQGLHASISADIQDSYKVPEACSMWLNREVDRKLPFKEKHVLQQASILGNLEAFGVLRDDHSTTNSDIPSTVIEFGAGKGYLTQMLADCYGIKKVLLVERKSYKLKADRSLRQKDNLILERLRIDIEDLNLNALESLEGAPYLATGKHLCGPATDMTLRCCLVGHCTKDDLAAQKQGSSLKGVAIATCCHHLCQWKHYINKRYVLNAGITKEEFHAITWFTSWAVDADHSSDLPDGVVDYTADAKKFKMESCGEEDACSVGDIFKDVKAVDRAVLGFMCKDIIDMGRLMWLKEEHGLDSKLVKYVPYTISPENRLLIARSP